MNTIQVRIRSSIDWPRGLAGGLAVLSAKRCCGATSRSSPQQCARSTAWASPLPSQSKQGCGHVEYGAVLSLAAMLFNGSDATKVAWQGLTRTRSRRIFTLVGNLTGDREDETKAEEDDAWTQNNNQSQHQDDENNLAPPGRAFRVSPF